MRAELLSKLDGSEEGLVELSKVLGHHHESMDRYATAENLRDLSSVLDAKFVQQHDSHDATKLLIDERDTKMHIKHDESRGAIYQRAFRKARGQVQ